MTTIVVVTTEHIARGEHENCERCPVALAIMDALPDAGPVAVEGGQVAFTDRGDWFAVELPRQVSEFIWDFDADGRGEPFSFELDYPAEVAP